MGGNGAGKSTFVKMLSGVVQPDGGTLTFMGEERLFHKPLAARLAGIETVHQSLGLVDGFDVAKNIFLGRELSRGRRWWGSLRERQMREEAAALVRRTKVNITDVRASVGMLSGGQRQGVAIARALGWNARLVILDEPTAALGVRETKEVEHIIQLLRDDGLGCLLISHDMGQVFRVADTVYVMAHGRTVGSGPVESFTESALATMVVGSGVTP